MTFVDLSACRCEGQPPNCRHRGVFVDQRGRDLPGMARWVETLDWVHVGRYRPFVEILGGDNLPIVVRW